MHELSIAINLVEIASEEIADLGPGRVDVVHLRLGPLSGVVQDALLFSYELATAGTPLEGSRLEIENVPVVIFCPQCRAERELPDLQAFRCPRCNTPSGEIVAGRELELRRLEFLADEDEGEVDADERKQDETKQADPNTGASKGAAEVR